MFEYEFHFLQVELARNSKTVHLILLGGTNTLCGKHVQFNFATGAAMILPQANRTTTCVHCRQLSHNLEALKMMTEQLVVKQPAPEKTTETATDTLGQKASQARQASRVRH